MRRREFIALIGSVAASWPFAVFAQQQNRMRVIGAISGIADESSIRGRYAVFLQELEKFGWTDGRNMHVVYRYGGGDLEDTRRQAAELVALAPDVILSSGAPATERLLQATRSIPIVFTIVPDPVGSGLVARLSRPGGNATGFVQFEYSLAGKWLELLKQIAPSTSRVAVLRDAGITAGIGQFAVIQSVAPSLSVEVSPINISNVAEIDSAIADFAREPNGALIVAASAFAFTHREQIVTLAAQYKLPAVYNAREFPASGGLISYGADFSEQYRRAADYVDRILKGEKPADLPVQAPTKYELIINLKTAKTLGLTMPPSLLASADKVIE